MLVNSEETIKKRVLYAEAVYGAEEKRAVLKSLSNKWLASGPLVSEFEQAIAKLFGKKYAVAVNSGSSANFLALQSLHLPEGSEVITPACTFATTVSTIVYNKLVPVFVDSVIGRYTVDESLIERAITKKTKAIMVPQLIGGVCDMALLKQIAKKHKLLLIDDSCDTLAPYLRDKQAAKYSDVTTTSFYGSHIITAMGFGGMVLTDSKEIHDRLLTIRDWGRVGNDKEAFEKRFNFSIDKIPYDAKFLYSELGQNCKMTEAGAAFALAQLKRLNKFLEIREYNFNALKGYFSQYEKFFFVPYLIKGAKTNWLAFPLTIKEGAPFTRYELLKHFEKKGIQTRVIFSGNITRHPVYRNGNITYRTSGSLKNADHIMAAGFLIGCHQGINKADVKYVIKSSEEFLKKFV